MCVQCSPPDERSRLDRRRLLAVGAGALAAASSWSEVADAAGSFELICKDAWGGRRHIGRLRRHEIDRITVHHSAVALTDDREAPARVRGHQRYHQSLGWADIAYHAVVDRNGNVYKGRPFWARGDSATDYDLRGHLLVMCEGNFESQRVTKAQRRSLADVLAWGCATFDVAPRRIHGHRHYAETACPGRNLARLIADGTIRMSVQRRLDRGGVAKVELCGAAGRRRVSAIERGES